MVEREWHHIKGAKITRDPSKRHTEVVTKDFLCWEGKSEKARQRQWSGFEWPACYKGCYKVGEKEGLILRKLAHPNHSTYKKALYLL